MKSRALLLTLVLANPALACMNSIVDVSSPWGGPGVFSLTFLAEVAVWAVCAGFLALGVLPMLAGAPLPQKLALGLGVLATLIVVGVWSAGAPVVGRILSGAAECVLHPGGLLLLGLGAPVLLVVHVGVLGLLRRNRTPGFMVTSLVASTLVLVFATTLVRESTVYSNLCITKVRLKDTFARENSGY